MRLGSGLLIGSTAAVLSSLPALVRLHRAGAPVLFTFLLLVGGTALALGPLVALGRRARPFSNGLYASLIGAGLSLPALFVLGRLIEQKTHHRPLGAATFSVLALLVVLGAAVVVGRVLTLVSSRRPAVIALALAVALAVLVAAQAFTSAGPFRASLVDALAVSSAAVLALVLPVPEAREERFRALALPIWGLLVLGGIVVSQTTVGDVVGELAPVLSPLNGW